MTSQFACRACGSRLHHEIVDFGDLPLCNKFVGDAGALEDEPGFPVALVMCGACQLLQLRELVSREVLFRSYAWTSSSSRSTVQYASEFAAAVAQRARPGNTVEIASNDGLLLERLVEVGFDAIGVEPSEHAVEASARGLPTLQEFFDRSVAERLVDERGPASLVVARNVLGHSSDMDGLLRGVSHLLDRDGLFVVEVPYAGFLRDQLQYDTIFHEHIAFFTMRTLHDVLQRHGLSVTRLSFSPLNGGSLVCDAKPGGHTRPEAVDALLEIERLSGLNRPDGWQRFRVDVEHHRRRLVELLLECSGRGEVVMGYGAAAKTVMLLNTCGIDRDLLPAIADASEHKRGRFTPGVGIPVVSPGELLSREPDHILIGPWNLATEIVQLLRGEAGFRGGLILPLPVPGFVDQPDLLDAAGSHASPSR